MCATSILQIKCLFLTWDLLQALQLNGTVLGDYPLKVLPSKTAIVPVNTQYLPKTTTEREKCSRTIYAANIDKKVDRESVKLFFETICGNQTQLPVSLEQNRSLRECLFL